MLKLRIIPILLVSGGRLVKSVRFEAFRDVGEPVASARVYNAQQADELVVLNIHREDRSMSSLLHWMERISAVSFMPLTAGGGIRSFEDAAALIRNGADKVLVNSACYRDPGLLTRIADRFGSQAVVVGIDVRRDPVAGLVELYSDCGRHRQRIGLKEHVDRCMAAGAGEFLIQSIDRDGSMAGYDLELIRDFVSWSRVPVVAAGGCGNYDHMRAAFQSCQVSGLACGSLFNFSDSNPMRAKAFLSNHALSFKVV